MKNAKRSLLHPTLVAAMFLGLTAINTHAEAAGIKLTNLKNIVDDFQVIQEGRTITFAGMIPERCATGAKVTKGFDNKAGGAESHFIILKLNPECEKDDFKRADDEKLMPLSKLIKKIELDDKSGKVVLRYLGADPSSKPKQDPIIGDDASELSITGSKEIAAAQAKAQAEKDAAEERSMMAQQKAERDARINALVEMCQNKDYVGLGNAIRAAEDLFEDVNLALKGLSEIQQKDFIARMAKAKNAEEAQRIYKEYLAFAAKNRLDAEGLDAKYVKKRLDLFKKDITKAKDDSGDIKLEEISSNLDEWKDDISSIGDQYNTANKKEIAALYQDIGLVAAEKRDYKLAETNLLKASRMVSKGTAASVKGEIAKMYKEGYNECLEAAKEKKSINLEKAIANCEKKYVNKARKYDNEVLSSLKKDKSDEGEERYNEAATNYAEYYGAGPSYTTTLGAFNPYAPGAYQADKLSLIQSYQQSLMMQQGLPGYNVYGNNVFGNQGANMYGYPAMNTQQFPTVFGLR